MKDRKKPKVLNKSVDVKFKTKSGRMIVFKAIETSLEPTREKKPTRGKKS